MIMLHDVYFSCCLPHHSSMILGFAAPFSPVSGAVITADWSFQSPAEFSGFFSYPNDIFHWMISPVVLQLTLLFLYQQNF